MNYFDPIQREREREGERERKKERASERDRERGDSSIAYKFHKLNIFALTIIIIIIVIMMHDNQQTSFELYRRFVIVRVVN